MAPAGIDSSRHPAIKILVAVRHATGSRDSQRRLWQDQRVRRTACAVVRLLGPLMAALLQQKGGAGRCRPYVAVDPRVWTILAKDVINED